MLTLSCHCGQIRLELARRPDHINECNCSLCGKRGARWAYLHPSEVRVEGATAGYSRADKEEPNADVRFCPACGCTTHFRLTESAQAKHGNVMMGVNMRLADEADLAGLELRYPDGRGWSAEGGFGYVREATIFGEGQGADRG
jgi:hypothetical protein